MAFLCIYTELLLKLLFVSSRAVMEEMGHMKLVFLLTLFLFLPNLVLVLIADSLLIVARATLFTKRVSSHWRQGRWREEDDSCISNCMDVSAGGAAASTISTSLFLLLLLLPLLLLLLPSPPPPP